MSGPLCPMEHPDKAARRLLLEQLGWIASYCVLLGMSSVEEDGEYFLETCYGSPLPRDAHLAYGSGVTGSGWVDPWDDLSLGIPCQQALTLWRQGYRNMARMIRS